MTAIEPDAELQSSAIKRIFQDFSAAKQDLCRRLAKHTGVAAGDIRIGTRGDQRRQVHPVLPPTQILIRDPAVLRQSDGDAGTPRVGADQFTASAAAGRVTGAQAVATARAAISGGTSATNLTGHRVATDIVNGSVCLHGSVIDVSIHFNVLIRRHMLDATLQDRRVGNWRWNHHLPGYLTNTQSVLRS